MAGRPKARKFVVLNSDLDDAEVITGQLKDVAACIEEWAENGDWSPDDVSTYVRVFEYENELKVVGEGRGVSAYFPL